MAQRFGTRLPRHLPLEQVGRILDAVRNTTYWQCPASDISGRTIEFLDRDEINALMGARRIGRPVPAVAIMRSCLLHCRPAYGLPSVSVCGIATSCSEPVHTFGAWEMGASTGPPRCVGKRKVLKERKGTDTDPLFPSSRGTWLPNSDSNRPTARALRVVKAVGYEVVQQLSRSEVPRVPKRCHL
jgi:hypothetical protein